jgi:hypothetical protein
MKSYSINFILFEIRLICTLSRAYSVPERKTSAKVSTILLRLFWACSQNCEKRIHRICLPACLSLYLFVRLSVRMEQLDPHWPDFHAI